MHSLTRRQVAQGLAALAGAAGLPRVAGAQNVELSATDLVAKPALAQLAPAPQPPTPVWAYGGSVPGPLLRLSQGARLTRRFVNALPQASSIHWHGIRIDNAMDGVPGMTQDAVAPGAAFVYDFVLPDAGTYWYHTHDRSWEQMARGLYGALVVDEPEGAPEVDLDEVLLIDDWRLTAGARIAEDFGALHDWAHGGRIGNWITVNGDGAWTRPVQRHARLRLRLGNVANARILALEARGFAGWIVALDGMPLEQPQPLSRLTLAPAQRADLLVDVIAEDGGEAMLVSLDRDGGEVIASFPVSGVASAARRQDPAPLPPNPVPALGPLAQARRASLRMEGGAMGGMRGAMMGGRMTPARELAAAGRVWAFNGMADMPEAPLIEAARGETLALTMINDTAWPHAMHLHGHHFRALSPDGTPGPLRDTLLVERGARAEIVLVADNPGDWMLHCHMLEHSAAGMMTWFRVT